MALHKYDPPDLLTSFADYSADPSAASSSSSTEEQPASIPLPTVAATPVQKRELEQAAAKGLLVDFGPDANAGTMTTALADQSPISVWSEGTPPRTRQQQLDEWDKADAAGGIDDGEESDDDLL